MPVGRRGASPTADVKSPGRFGDLVGCPGAGCTLRVACCGVLVRHSVLAAPLIPPCVNHCRAAARRNATRPLFGPVCSARRLGTSLATPAAGASGPHRCRHLRLAAADAAVAHGRQAPPSAARAASRLEPCRGRSAEQRQQQPQQEPTALPSRPGGFAERGAAARGPPASLARPRRQVPCPLWRSGDCAAFGVEAAPVHAGALRHRHLRLAAAEGSVAHGSQVPPAPLAE